MPISLKKNIKGRTILLQAWFMYHQMECRRLRRSILRKIFPLTSLDMLRLMIRIILKLKTEEDNLMLFGKEKEFVTLPNGIKRSFDDLMSHKEDIIKDDSKMNIFMVSIIVHDISTITYHSFKLLNILNLNRFLVDT